MTVNALPAHAPGDPALGASCPTRRALLTGSAAGLAVALGADAAPAARITPPAPDPLVLDDTSRLNPTRVARHARLDGTTDGTIAALRRLLAEAAHEDRPSVVGGARHSMGGQSLYAGATAATAAGFDVEPDVAARRYRVSAGARWREIVPALDRVGLSVAVMQSNSDFSVGGTLCVNGHGWALPYGAFAQTVQRFRLMLADGTLLTCAPDENAALFRAVIGGYGLLGVVVDAELDAVANVALAPRLRTLAAAGIGPALASTADRAAASRLGAPRMAYGRLSLAPDAFLTEALLVAFEEASGPPPGLDADSTGLFGLASRTLMRAQAGSDWSADLGKAARWWTETRLAPHLAPARLSRNRLLSQPVAALGRPGPGRTDILHEYFLPPERLADFLIACREAIPGSGQDLLNVTLRYVAVDPVSLLTFAPAPRVAAVMLFDQASTAGAEAVMRGLTERLVEATLKLGGSVYPPYRLQARRDQVRQAYPGLDALLALKREYDPRGRFRNALLDTYFAKSPM